MDSDEPLKVLEPEDKLRAEGKKEWSASSAREMGEDAPPLCPLLQSSS